MMAPAARRVYRLLFGGLIALTIILTLVELLAVPAGACASSAAGAACLRQRIVILMPWAGLAVAIALLLRRQQPPQAVRPPMLVERRGGKPLARLYVLEGPTNLVGKTIPLYARRSIIGRDPAVADIQLYRPNDRSALSGAHCTIRYDRGQFTLTDNQSANGTFVNDQQLAPQETVVLQDGDEITLGDAARYGAVLRFGAGIPAISILPAPASKPNAAAPVDARRTGVFAMPNEALESRLRSEQAMDSLLSEVRQASRTGMPRVATAERKDKTPYGGVPRAPKDTATGIILDPDDAAQWANKPDAPDDRWTNGLG